MIAEVRSYLKRLNWTRIFSVASVLLLITSASLGVFALDLKKKNENTQKGLKDTQKELEEF